MPTISSISTPFSIGTLVQLGTNGSILFVDSSGDVAQDNTNLRFDNTGKILTLISGIKVDSSGIYPTVANTKNLGLFQNKFASAWITNISGTNLQSATANTPSTASNNTDIATTAFVQSNLSSYLPMTSGTILATLVSPTFLGDPKAPTASGADSDTSIATTDFTKMAISGARTGSIGFGFPSGTLAAGMESLAFTINTGRTIRGITLLGEGSGSCSIDIWKVGYANYPLGSANTIFTGINRATIVSGIKSRDTSLSTLISPTINRFDTMKAKVSSVSGLTGVTLILDTWSE